MESYHRDYCGNSSFDATIAAAALYCGTQEETRR